MLRSTLRLMMLAAAGLIAAALPALAFQVERVVSPGGIEAWLVRDAQVPVVALDFAFRGAGAAQDAEGKGGLSSLMTTLLTEGAGDLDSGAFQARLDDLNISMGFSAGLDNLRGSMKALNRHRDEAERLLRLALSEPRFDPPAVERVRARALQALDRAAENPDAVAAETWMATAFPGHPYGRRSSGTPDSVKAITIDELKAARVQRLGRDRLVVAAVGDIAPAELGAMLDRVFSGLPAAAALYEVPPVMPAGAGQTLVVQRAVPQSKILFGHAGPLRDDPDFYAAHLVNYILGGGGFNSRLTTEVREKRGLAYGVYSYLATYERTGLVMGGTGTENARAAQSLEIIRAEWARMAEAGPTEEELEDAKRYVTGSFPLNLDSTQRIARILLDAQIDKRGLDFLERRTAEIEKVTIADARRVARALLDPARLLTVVVGEPQGFSQAPAPATAPRGG